MLLWYRDFFNSESSLFKVDLVMFYGLQIVSAVQYCHQKRIVHRDLKVLYCIIVSYTV